MVFLNGITKRISPYLIRNISIIQEKLFLEEEKMTVPERLSALRTLMKKRGISAYMIPSEDFHGSEYVGGYFKAREFMSGFTGSAGTLLVMAERAFLWTDGRYFLQAAEQLEGTGIGLMKMGEPGVPTLTEFLAQELPENSRLGFDGRVVSAALSEKIARVLREKNVVISADEDLVDAVWAGRPSLPAEKVWTLDKKYAGSTREKLERVRAALKKEKCDILLVSAPEEAAWLLGLRGSDVECTPVFLSFMLISADKAVLFANNGIFDAEIRKRLADDGIALAPYPAVYGQAEHESVGKRVWADPARTNHLLMRCLAGAEKIVKKPTPIELMKAVKSPEEQEGMRRAHILDGVACTKFIFWLKTHVGKERITEISAARKLLEFRKAQTGFVEPSFETIMAYAAHGAIVHYAPTPETDCEMLPHGLCLVDSGAHYAFGTTDITRTVVLGALTDEERRGFTLAMKGHLRLRNAKFRYGCGGGAVDCLAREALWENGLDYNHGTGHGVGFVLSVHEGPQRVHWNSPNKSVTFEPGMVTSNEPGFYAAGKFGVRHENLLLCVEKENNEYGRFLGFENLTLVPFDTDGLDISLLDEKEKRLLNDYHAQVREAISQYLEPEEKLWLEKAAAPIS